jgi:hypothetical protein
MYATVRRYEGVSDPSEVARIANEGFLPIIREIEGFVDYYLVDGGDGVLISTSIFESASGEEESYWRAGEFVEHHLTPLLPNPPHITAGAVVAHERRHTGFES